MPAATRVGKIIGPYKRRKLDRTPISPYTRGLNTAALKTSLGVENKYFDVEVATAFVSSVNYGLLNATSANPAILLGDEVYQRNGRQILLKKVAFRGNVFTTPITAQTSAAPCTSGRIFLWRNDQTGNPPGNIISMADGTAFSSVANALGGFQSPSANGIGKIVDDMQFQLVPTVSTNNNGATTVSSSAQEVPVKLSYKPKKPMKLIYPQAALSPVPDKWFALYGVVDATTFLPSLNGVMRFYYTDA